MRRLLSALAPAILLTFTSPVHAQDALSAARALYSAARYEDALGAFDAMKSGDQLTPDTALAVEQGRAYCLLALGRRADAQTAIATIVNLDPFFVPGEGDTPPKLRAAFRDARRRALPDTLNRMYSRAKAAYDGKDFVSAASAFSRILALLHDPDLALEPGPGADMRLMAMQFLGLTQSASPLFDASSKNVTRPVPVQTTVAIPDAVRPAGAARTMEVEVVVTAYGAVESATVRQPDAAGLAPLVVRAVLEWRYRPALRAGKPVRYRMVVQVVIPSRGA
jgi:hypothetical protein